MISCLAGRPEILILLDQVELIAALLSALCTVILNLRRQLEELREAP